MIIILAARQLPPSLKLRTDKSLARPAFASPSHQATDEQSKATARQEFGGGTPSLKASEVRGGTPEAEHFTFAKGRYIKLTQVKL